MASIFFKFWSLDCPLLGELDVSWVDSVDVTSKIPDSIRRSDQMEAGLNQQIRPVRCRTRFTNQTSNNAALKISDQQG